MFALVFVAAQLLGPARPVEVNCGAQQRLNVWERVKSPALGRYCDLLASGSSKLGALTPQPALALQQADLADAVLPGQAAPAMVRGRALEQLAKYTESFADFTTALARDSAALDEAAPLHAYARAAAMTGHPAVALKAYRALLPRASVLPVPERGSAYLEAGLLLLGEGSALADDAIVVLRQAGRETHGALGLVAAVALALALDRADLRDESEAVLSDRRANRASALADRGVRVALAVMPDEAAAVSALALEVSDRAGAAAAWRAYAERLGPWAAHARLRATTLLAPGGARR